MSQSVSPVDNESSAMLKRKMQLEQIQSALVGLESLVATGGKLGFTDLNVHSEEFVRGLLNRVYGWALVGANSQVSNFPCIDLIDPGRQIGVQVTSERGSSKINGCLECCASKLSDSISKLYVFSLVKKQGKYTLSSVAGVSFDKSHIIDFIDIIKIAKSMDGQEFECLHAYIVESFSHLSPDVGLSGAAIKQSISDCLRVLDREVLSAPFRYEDPVLMFRAIVEIRRSLRSMGAGRVFDSIAAGEFGKIVNELVACERMIKDEYPYIANPEPGGPDFEVVDRDAYWHESVRRMMAIREPIDASRSIIEGRLLALQ